MYFCFGLIPRKKNSSYTLHTTRVIYFRAKIVYNSFEKLANNSGDGGGVIAYTANKSTMQQQKKPSTMQIHVNYLKSFAHFHFNIFHRLLVFTVYRFKSLFWFSVIINIKPFICFVWLLLCAGYCTMNYNQIM